MPLEHAADVDGVGTLGPGQVILFGELVLKIAERVDESRPQRGEVRNGHISVLSRGSKELQCDVFGRLDLSDVQGREEDAVNWLIRFGEKI